MTEQIQINRKKIYLTIEKLKFDTEKGIEIKENQFTTFFKLQPVNEVNLGEQIKSDNGEVLIFDSVEQARNESIKILKRKIYPPSFLNPMDYRGEAIIEIMHKELKFDIGKSNSDEILESITGIMTNCTLASTSYPQNLPYSVRIFTNNSSRSFRISEIKQIRR